MGTLRRDSCERAVSKVNRAGENYSPLPHHRTCRSAYSGSLKRHRTILFARLCSRKIRQMRHIAARVVYPTFGTSLPPANSSAYYAFAPCFCSSGHDFAIPSSLLHLAMQTLGAAFGLLGNYLPVNLHSKALTCPSYQGESFSCSQRKIHVFFVKPIAIMLGI